MPNQRDDMYSRSQLMTRGWSKSMISKHLPDADGERVNPVYRNAAPMKFWLKARVHELEACAAIKEAIARGLTRRNQPKTTGVIERRRLREQELISQFVKADMSPCEASKMRQLAINKAYNEFYHS